MKTNTLIPKSSREDSRKIHEYSLLFFALPENPTLFCSQQMNKAGSVHQNLIKKKMMKKITLLIAAICVGIGLSSCSKADFGQDEVKEMDIDIQEYNTSKKDTIEYRRWDQRPEVPTNEDE